MCPDCNVVRAIATLAEDVALKQNAECACGFASVIGALGSKKAVPKGRFLFLFFSAIVIRMRRAPT